MKFKTLLWDYDLQPDDKKTKCAIKIRVSHKNKIKYRLTNFYVSRSQFENGRVKNHDNKEAINSELRLDENALEAYYLKNRNCSIDELINYDKLEKLEEEIKAAANVTLLDFIDKYSEDVKAGKISDPKTGKAIKWGSHFNSLATHLRTFSKEEEGYRGINYEHITDQFYQDFIHFMRHEFLLKVDKKTKEKIYGAAENTIGKDIKNLKKFMKLTRKAGYHSNLAYEDFSVITDQVEPIILSEEEIAAISSADLTHRPELIEEQERCLVAYNFLLRFNDSVNLDPGSFIQEKGTWYLRHESQKTGEFVYIPVKERTLAILQKHSFKLPHVHNQESNWKLKELCSYIGIDRPFTRRENRGGKSLRITYKAWELVTTHTFRRTRATHLHDAGFSLYEIMNMGGWRDERQLKRYIHIDKKKLGAKAALHPAFA